MDFLWRWKNKLLKDGIATLSAALAFYAALSLAPLLLLLLAILASLRLDFLSALLEEIRALFGGQATIAIEAIVRQANLQAHARAFAHWSGAAVMLFSASLVFAQLQYSLNVIFGAPERASDKTSWMGQAGEFLLRRLFCFGVVLAFILFSLLSLTASILLTLMMKPTLFWWLRPLHLCLNFGIFSLLFAAIFRWMPDCAVSAKASLRGGMLTALFFGLGRGLISLYLRKAALGSAYGAAGSLILLLAWVYYSSLILFSGAEISALLNKPKPAPIAPPLQAKIA